MNKKYEFIALVAALVNMVALLPQFLKTYKSGNTGSFCPRSLSFKLIGSLILLSYAYLKRLPVVFIGAVGTIILDIWLLYKIKTAKLKSIG